MLEILQAKFRRFTQNKGAAPVDVRGTGLESIAIAQVEGQYDEACRAGIRFRGSAYSATGIAPVQAIPTTAAQWLLYNPNPASGITAFFDEIGVYLISGTAGAGASLLACMVPVGNIPATLPTLTSGCSFRNANPASTRTSNMVMASSQTLQATAYANQWWVLANEIRSDTVLGQVSLSAPFLNGSICCPPGCGIALAVISPTGTTPLFAPYTTLREYSADME